MDNLIIPRTLLRLKTFYACEEYALTAEGGFELAERGPDLEEQINQWLTQTRHQLGFVSAPTVSKLDIADGGFQYITSLAVLYIPAENTRDPQQPPPKKISETTAPASGTIPAFGRLRVPGPQLVRRDRPADDAGSAVSAEAAGTAGAQDAGAAPADLR